MTVQGDLMLHRIVRDPDILGGKPVVRGIRIPAALVLGHLEGHPDLADLFAAYLRLTVDDVRAVLAYALAGVEASSNRVPQPVGVEPR